MNAVIVSVDRRLTHHYADLQRGGFQVISRHRRVMNLKTQGEKLFSIVERGVAPAPRQVRVMGQLTAHLIFPSVAPPDFDCTLQVPACDKAEAILTQAWQRLAQCASYPVDGFSQTLQRYLQDAIAALLNALDNAVYPPVAELIGLGQGLTPDGDDFLCGILIATALPISPYRAYRDWLVQAVRHHLDHTHCLSAAFLEDACQQQIAAPIQTLIDSFANPLLATDAIDAVLAMGHRSGSSLLSGILAGLPHSKTRRYQLCPYIAV